MALTPVTTRLKRFFRSFFPAPRQPLTWRRIGPLVLFLVLFLGTCVALQFGQIVAFSRLWPFGLLAVTPWLWWMSFAGAGGLTPRRSLIALLTRLSVFGLLIIALAEPRAVRQDDRLTVVYAVDLSGSVAPQATDEALKYVSRVGQQEKPEKDLSALVYFAREAAVQLPPKAEVSHEELRAVDVQVHRDGSNIAQALSLSAAILPESQNGRIVLITDGVPTDGDLSPTLRELRAKDIAVDVLPVGYRYEDEVWLERLDLPRFVKEGQTYEAGILLSSLKAGRGNLILLENGQKIAEEQVDFSAGKNRYVLPIRLREPGYFEYAAHIIPETKDSIEQNNIAIGSLFLEGQGRLLLVTDPEGDARDWQMLVRMLKEADFVIEQMSAYECPQDSIALKSYDCVIFANVPRVAFDDVQIQAVHDAVFHHGTGFLMIGGSHSFGPGGWAKTPVEKALPVEMDISQRKTLMNGALVFALDRSGSMGEGVPGTTANKQVIANKAAIAAMSTLTARDWLGVVAFDSTSNWVIPLSPNSNPDNAAQQVRKIAHSGGTNMFPALDDALNALQKLPEGEAAVKHIILLTDGQSPGDAAAFVQRCIEARISVSTIGIGGPEDVNEGLLEFIAHQTDGRFYPVKDAQTLPRVMVREAVTLRRTAIRNEPVTPAYQSPSPILKGIEGVPSLQGMVLTTPRPRAEIVLGAPSEEEGETDPILALQRYGLGRTAAFTSDLSPNWGRDWMQWPQYEAFLKQLITEISRTRKPSNLEIQTIVAGNEGVLQIQDHSPEAGMLNLHAVIDGPGDRGQELKLDQVGPKRYQARFPLSGEGRYWVMALGEGEERATEGFAVPYSQEYLRFAANPLVLDQIAETTGGRVLTGQESGQDIYAPNRQPKLSTRSIVEQFLILLTFLIPLDVGIRRIQIDGSLLRGWFSPSSLESGETMSALLQRKQDVAKSLQTATVQPLVKESASLPRPEKRETIANPDRRSPGQDSEETHTTAMLRRLAERHRDRQRSR